LRRTISNLSSRPRFNRLSSSDTGSGLHQPCKTDWLPRVILITRPKPDKKDKKPIPTRSSLHSGSGPVPLKVSASASACVSTTILKTDCEGKSEGNPYKSPEFRITSTHCRHRVERDREKRDREKDEEATRQISAFFHGPCLSTSAKPDEPGLPLPRPRPLPRPLHAHSSPGRAPPTESGPALSSSTALQQPPLVRLQRSLFLCRWLQLERPRRLALPPGLPSGLKPLRLAPNLNLLLHRNCAWEP